MFDLFYRRDNKKIKYSRCFSMLPDVVFVAAEMRWTLAEEAMRTRTTTI